jgi:hypothetical protein
MERMEASCRGQESKPAANERMEGSQRVAGKKDVDPQFGFREKN